MPVWETRLGSDKLAGAEPGEFTLEKGYVMFKRKPAKMGEDYIFWIPRVYVRNRLVDPSSEYDIFLRKEPVKKRPRGTRDAGEG
jgi:hypothetical protein